MFFLLFVFVLFCFKLVSISSLSAFGIMSWIYGYSVPKL